MDASNQAAACGWHGLAATAASERHRAKGIPCQDAARAGLAPRPYLIVCDGRGSSTLSQVGAEAAVARFPEILERMEMELAEILDAPDLDQREPWRKAVEQICEFLVAQQTELVARDGVDLAAYEYTLAAAIVGETACGWLAIGDSVLLAETSAVIGLLSLPAVEEFANCTRFVGPRLRMHNDVRCGLVPTANLRGLVALTDGMSAHLVDWKRCVPTAGVRQLGEALARGLSAEELTAILEATRWCELHDDDRGLALLFREKRESSDAIMPLPVPDSAIAH